MPKRKPGPARVRLGATASDLYYELRQEFEEARNSIFDVLAEMAFELDGHITRTLEAHGEELIAAVGARDEVVERLARFSSDLRAGVFDQTPRSDLDRLPSSKHRLLEARILDVVLRLSAEAALQPDGQPERAREPVRVQLGGHGSAVLVRDEAGHRRVSQDNADDEAFDIMLSMLSPEE